MFSSKISIWLRKSILQIKIFVIIKIFLSKNMFKVALYYLFNVFILYNTVSYLKLNFKPKIDPKMFTYKNLEEILKTWKFFWKTSGNPVYSCMSCICSVFIVDVPTFKFISRIFFYFLFIRLVIFQFTFCY